MTSIFDGRVPSRTNFYFQKLQLLWTPPTRPEHPNRPDSGHPTTVQSNSSVQLWSPPTRPEHTKRPESGRSDTGQSALSVKNLDALHLNK